MSNINSFAENMNKVVENNNNMINILNGVQQSIIGNTDNINISLTDSNHKETSLSIPTLNHINKKVNAVEESINSLMQGKGVVALGDGTARNVKISNIAVVPSKITELNNPTTFSIDPNWWFEDMMFPAAKVTISLIGKIDDTADKVKVNRVILDYNDTVTLAFYNNTLKTELDNNISYENLKNELNAASIPYREDEEILNLPYSHIHNIGNFYIEDVDFNGSEEWFKISHHDDTTLSPLEYKHINEDDETNFDKKTLKIGDKLSVNNYLYEITDINEDDNLLKLNCTIGYAMPQTGQTLVFYNEPWTEKNVDVRFSSDEIDIVYFKGINDEFNIIGNEWSDPVYFATNELVDSNGNAFIDYYNSSIVDFGKDMISKIQLDKIEAPDGYKPEAPLLNLNNFSVVQINTQFNEALDQNEILKMKKDIETTKSQLSSTKDTIQALQTKKQSIKNDSEYNSITAQLNTLTTNLKQLQSSYQTSLNTMQSILLENNAVDVSPKYHIRGFFDIPTNKPTNTSIKQQAIIGFDIVYRYLKQNDTGVDLKKFSYNGANGAEHTGVYTDWNLKTSKFLEKQYNSTTGKYEWVNESISDGNAININQIDIPITKGEKVEFKVRSISEAGYPYNPLKSDWSESITMEFPENLMTSSDIENLIKDINSENVQITVNNQLESNGLLTHINDSLANINSINNTYFKHEAKNISYELYDSVNKTIKTVSLQEALDGVYAFINAFMDYADKTNRTEQVHTLNLDSLIQKDFSIILSTDGITNSYIEYNIPTKFVVNWKYINGNKITNSKLYINQNPIDVEASETSYMVKDTLFTEDVVISLSANNNGISYSSNTVRIPVRKKIFYGYSPDEFLVEPKDDNANAIFKDINNSFNSTISTWDYIWAPTLVKDTTGKLYANEEFIADDINIDIPKNGGYWYILVPKENQDGDSFADDIMVFEGSGNKDIYKVDVTYNGLKYVLISDSRKFDRTSFNFKISN